MTMPILFQVMIGSNLKTTFPDNLQITSKDNSSTLTIIVTVVVVFCVAGIATILILLILRRYTQHRNRKPHLNEIVAELEHRNLTDKSLTPSKSIQI